MQLFLKNWAESAYVSAGFFWMAFWAFALGYLISSLIQVLVTRQRMKDTMGDTGIRSIGLGVFFGFISSSCSFAALSTTRALFKKGAGLVPALAFMLASTNLVIELGIVIALFLSWQFVVGEYLGGLLLILFAWLFVKVTKPEKLIRNTRKRMQDGKQHKEGPHHGGTGWKTKIRSFQGWMQIGTTYVMEWQMVWKDVLIGFTIAGIISAFVPDRFFEALFIGSGTGGSGNPVFLQVLIQTLIGPVAAFFTFIGSMGNIPLAALLYDHGVSFAGVMAFIFSDLVVFPVLRINAGYYGWKMSFYLLALLLSCLTITSVLMHYGFSLLDLLPASGNGKAITDRQMFTLNYGLVLNLIFLVITIILVWFWLKNRDTASHDNHGETHDHDHDHSENSSTHFSAYIFNAFTFLAAAWLTGGLILKAVGFK